MYHVCVTFLLSSRDVLISILMDFHFRKYGVSKCMCYVCVTYVWRMKCTRDIFTANVLRSILICGVSVLYKLLFSSTARSA